VGSKIDLLNRFMIPSLFNAHYGALFIVAGYDETIYIKDVVQSMYRYIREVKEDNYSEKRMEKQLEYIFQFLNLHNRKHDTRMEYEDAFSDLLVSDEPPSYSHMDLYVLVHSIDGKTFRSEEAQSIFAKLASHPHIHLVASIDHVNANARKLLCLTRETCIVFMLPYN